MKARNPSTGTLETVYVKALDSLPVGIIVEFPTTDETKVPTGYMFCDGRELSRTEYSELFSLIGTYFGAGDGSTTFNIPSKEGLVTAGIKSSDTDFDTIGEILGEKTHQLTVNELAAHTHAVRNNLGGIDSSANTGTGSWGQKLSYTASGATAISSNAYVAQNTGGNVPHNNIQPTQVSNFIIKVKPTRALAGNIVNAYSESQNSTYSCDYVNGCNTYSASETFTGKYWIDGKKIYRKVLTDTYSTSGSAEFTINLPITSSVDTMISYDGTHGVTTGSLTRYKNRIGFPTTTGINYSSTMYFDSTNNRIVVIIGGKGSSAIAWCTVIVEYTKTTD